MSWSGRNRAEECPDNPQFSVCDCPWHDLTYCPVCCSTEVRPTPESNIMWECPECRWRGARNEVSEGE